jgi:hypothetical protein
MLICFDSAESVTATLSRTYPNSAQRADANSATTAVGPGNCCARTGAHATQVDVLSAIIRGAAAMTLASVVVVVGGWGWLFAVGVSVASGLLVGVDVVGWGVFG